MSNSSSNVRHHSLKEDSVIGKVETARSSKLRNKMFILNEAGTQKTVI